jgi:hypothetical protein
LVPRGFTCRSVARLLDAEHRLARSAPKRITLFDQ